MGREPELQAARTLLGSGGSGRALVITGEAGIGKTTLWQAIVDAARDGDLRTLCAWPTDAEARLSYAGLADLFDEVELEELVALPSPQAHALALALARAEAEDGSPPAPNAIALATLNALRALAAEGPVLLAIDDAPALDPGSSEALAFAARRLGNVDIRFLLARRPGRPSPLERALGPREPRHLPLGPLSLGASRRILHDRLGLTLPRRTLRRIVDATRGNPLFLLEIGRSFLERATHEVQDDGIPIPDSVEDLLGTRVAALPPRSRRLLLALGLSEEARTSTLARLVGARAIDEAERAGLVLLDGERVLPAHPLLVAAARRRSGAGERRELHRRLADLTDDGQLRVLHLAFAAEEPDPGLSAVLSAAGSRAFGRGDVERAALLAEHALRLTPGGSHDAPSASSPSASACSPRATSGEPRICCCPRSTGSPREPSGSAGTWCSRTAPPSPPSGSTPTGSSSPWRRPPTTPRSAHRSWSAWSSTGRWAAWSGSTTRRPGRARPWRRRRETTPACGARRSPPSAGRGC